MAGHLENAGATSAINSLLRLRASSSCAAAISRTATAVSLRTLLGDSVAPPSAAVSSVASIPSRLRDSHACKVGESNSARRLIKCCKNSRERGATGEEGGGVLVGFLLVEEVVAAADSVVAVESRLATSCSSFSAFSCVFLLVEFSSRRTITAKSPRASCPSTIAPP